MVTRPRAESETPVAIATVTEQDGNTNMAVSGKCCVQTQCPQNPEELVRIFKHRHNPVCLFAFHVSAFDRKEIQAQFSLFLHLI